MKIIMIVKGIPDSFTIINIGLEAFHLFQHQHMCLHEEIPCRSDREKSYQIEINPSAIFCSKYIFWKKKKKRKDNDAYAIPMVVTRTGCKFYPPILCKIFFLIIASLELQFCL